MTLPESDQAWDTKTAQLIVQGLVVSNIDYCNSLLAGFSQYQLNKLQQIQNMSCWVICNIRKPMITSLQQWKISTGSGSLQRIAYKLCLLVYKCQNNLAPWYLSDLLQSRPCSRLLRSSQSDNIYAAYFKNSQCQLSSFSSAGPRAWNAFPVTIKTGQLLDIFKTLLKTYLFNISYND